VIEPVSVIELVEIRSSEAEICELRTPQQSPRVRNSQFRGREAATSTQMQVSASLDLVSTSSTTEK